MRWPWMTLSRHDRIVAEMHHQHVSDMAVLSEAAADAVDQEYARATREGRAQVHAWARDATWNVFTAARPRLAFQEAESIFAPAKTDVKEIFSAPVSA